MTRPGTFLRTTSALAMIMATIAMLSCNDHGGRTGVGQSDVHRPNAASQLRPRSGTTARADAINLDSIRAEIYAEVRREFAANPVVRIRLDSIEVPVEDTSVVDSLKAELEETRRIAHDAIGIIRRMQDQLRALPGTVDVLAVLDTSTCIDEAESCFSVRAEYSQRDAAYKNVTLRHEWIERNATVWDAVIEYAPYVGGILALVKIGFDTFSNQ